jgi:hypothetical protein
MVDDNQRAHVPAIEHVAPLGPAGVGVGVAAEEHPPAAGRRGSAFARFGAPVALVAAGLVGGAAIGGIASANASPGESSAATATTTRGSVEGSGETDQPPGMQGGRGDHGAHGQMPRQLTGQTSGQLPGQSSGQQLQQMPQSHGSTGASG